MQHHLSRILSLLMSLSFAAVAATAFAAPASHQQLARGAHARPTPQYCKKHPMDPRCKK